MKKTLIAAAALVAAAGAMAEVTVTGTIDATLRMSDNGAEKATTVGRDGSGTTGVIFKISEDLGDGLKAIGLYEHDFNFMNAQARDAIGPANDGTGERYVGLEGGFGSIKLGTPNAPSLTIQSGLRGAPFGTKDGGRGGAGNGIGAAAGGATMFGKNLTRYAGSIVYTTPSLNGLTVSVDYVPGTEGTHDGAGGYLPNEVEPITDIGVFYRSGPIWAGVAVYTQDEEQLTHLGVHYNLGFMTIGAGYHTYTNAAGDDANTGFNLLANVPLSEQLSLGLNYQVLSGEDGVDEDATQIAVGVNYRLSKTTSVYARYVSLDDDAAADPASTILAGLRVDF
jgi:predicted porin